MTYTGQDPSYARVLNLLNNICTWFFVVELMIFWLGMGVQEYFRDNWNVFDFLVVVASIIEFFSSVGLLPFALGFNPSFFRVVRMTRIFKLVRKFPRLAQLGQTVWFSLPALYNVALLLFLLFFVYSILCMSLFGKVKHGYYINNHANFETFTGSMVTLFRMMTGENWNGIMRDCMVQAPFCDGDNCGNPIISPLIHCSFQVFSTMLIIDLIVAVILNQFENELAKEKRANNFVTEEDINKFGTLWSKFSPVHTIPVSKLPLLLRLLDQPLGLEDANKTLTGVAMASYIDNLQIPCDGKEVHYLDVIHQLGERVFYITYPTAEPAIIVNDEGFIQPMTTGGIPLTNEDLKLIRQQAHRQFPVFKSPKKWTGFAGVVHRIVLIQKLMRGFVIRNQEPVKILNSRMASRRASLASQISSEANENFKKQQAQLSVKEEDEIPLKTSKVVDSSMMKSDIMMDELIDQNQTARPSTFVQKL